MADLSNPTEPSLQTSGPDRPLLSAMPASSSETSYGSDAELGYESALPWVINDPASHLHY